LTPIDYLLNLLNTYLPFPYNIGLVIIILGSIFLVEFYSKRNKEKVEVWLNSNSKKIMSITILVMTLTTLSFGSYFYYEHYIFPDSPKDHFRVAISPLDTDDANTAQEIKEKIESTARSAIEVMILDPPPVVNNDEAILQGKRVGANFCIFGGDVRTLGKAFKTILYVLPVDSSQYKQLFGTMNKTLFQYNKSGELNPDIKNGIITLSSKPFVNNPIILESTKEIIPSCVYTICAFEYYTEFKYDEAISLFENVTNYENNSMILFYIGNSYYFQNKFNQSLQYYNKSIEINPQDSDAWVGQGNALKNLNKYNEAIKAYNRAIEINPHNSNAWYNKGFVLDELGELDEAIKAFDKAIKINPQNIDAWVGKGLVLDNLNKYDEALRASDKAIEINPHNSIAWLSKGIDLFLLNKYDEAIKAYDKVIEINPQDTPATFAMAGKGFALWQLNKSEEAIKAFDQAIEINPRDTNAWGIKGLALQQLNKSDEAIKAYDKAIEINPQYSDAWNGKGDTLSKLGKLDEAIKAYDKAIEINPQYSGAWNGKGDTLSKLSKLDEAIKAYDKAIEINPHNSRAWYNRARIYSLIDNKDQAIFNLKKAIQLDSSHKEEVKKENDFKRLWADEKFKEIIK
jgi:tetratricopeptide (TPR) repeat protein